MNRNVTQQNGSRRQRRSTGKHAPIRLTVVAKYGFLAAGVICLVVLIRQAGWGRLAGELRLIGWGFFVYMGIHATEEALKTIAWQVSFPKYRKIGFRKLYLANMAGAAVTHIYHLGFVGSGTTRVIMTRDEVSTQQGIASVLISTLADAVALVLFIAGGLIFVLAEPEIPGSLKAMLLISFCLLSLSIGIFWALQRKGMPGWSIRLLERLPVSPAIKSRLLKKAGDLNESVREYHDTSTARFWTAVGLYFFRRFFNVAQVQLVLYLLNTSGGFHDSFLITIFSNLIDALFFFVPGRLGAHEGGRLLISKTLGLTTAQGLTIGVVSRLNHIVWGILGFGILFFRTGVAAPKDASNATG